jgi:hypothetical protein
MDDDFLLNKTRPPHGGLAIQLLIGLSTIVVGGKISGHHPSSTPARIFAARLTNTEQGSWLCGFLRSF